MKPVYFLALLIGLSMSLAVQAQKRENLIGIRGGYAPGITFQHYLANDRAVEVILSNLRGGSFVTALYEVHTPAFDVNNLYWFYGAGGHVGFYRYRDGGRWRDPYFDEGLLLGVDGIIGLEYFFADIPFQLSVDWKPAFSIIGYSGFLLSDGAVSLRYCF
jgi:hypothetical protein